MLDRLKKLVLEEEPVKKSNSSVVPASQAAAATARPNPSPGMIQTNTYTPPVTAPVNYGPGLGVSADNEAYDRLSAATAFENTNVGKILQKYLEPLKNVPMDPTIKMKSAIAQAVAIDKISNEQILAAFESLQAQLGEEQISFENWRSTKQGKIAELTQQIGDLQKQINEASIELSNTQTKLTVGETKFSAAMQRRRAEIEQQAAQYRSYLQ